MRSSVRHQWQVLRHSSTLLRGAAKNLPSANALLREFVHSPHRCIRHTPVPSESTAAQPEAREMCARCTQGVHEVYEMCARDVRENRKRGARAHGRLRRRERFFCTIHPPSSSSASSRASTRPGAWILSACSHVARCCVRAQFQLCARRKRPRGKKAVSLFSLISQ